MATEQVGVQFRKFNITSWYYSISPADTQILQVYILHTHVEMMMMIIIIPFAI